VRIVQVTPDLLPLLLRSPELFDRPLSVAAARRYLADPRNVCFVAVDRDATIGFLRGTELDQMDSDRKQMFLYEIAVVPDHRREGAGRALVRALLEYCRERGFEEAFVFTDPSNEPAVALYRSTGGATETPADRMFVYRLTPP
jgi:aminoglycoside 3-N-acetyltransferase I